MLALNCMLGKNKSKTLYNCNCLSVVVNVYVKDSQLFMIIDRHAYYYFVSKSWWYLFEGKIMFQKFAWHTTPKFHLTSCLKQFKIMMDYNEIFILHWNFENFLNLTKFIPFSF